MFGFEWIVTRCRGMAYFDCRVRLFAFLLTGTQVPARGRPNVTLDVSLLEPCKSCSGIGKAGLHLVQWQHP